MLLSQLVTLEELACLAERPQHNKSGWTTPTGKSAKRAVPILDVCHDVRRKSGDEFNTPQKWVSKEDKGKIGHESWKGIVNNEQRYPSWQLLIDEQVHPTVSFNTK